MGDSFSWHHRGMMMIMMMIMKSSLFVNEGDIITV